MRLQLTEPALGLRPHFISKAATIIVKRHIAINTSTAVAANHASEFDLR